MSLGLLLFLAEREPGSNKTRLEELWEEADAAAEAGGARSGFFKKLAETVREAERLKEKEKAEKESQDLARQQALQADQARIMEVLNRAQALAPAPRAEDLGRAEARPEALAEAAAEIVLQREGFDEQGLGLALRARAAAFLRDRPLDDLPAAGLQEKKRG